MKLTRLSMFYLVSYLWPAGLALLFAPELAFKLLQSNANGAYGDVIPRMAGGVILALGMIVVQIIRHELEVLHPTTLAVRVMLVSVLVALYVRAHDPFFLVVAGIVALGMALTTIGLLRERRSSAAAPAR